MLFVTNLLTGNEKTPHNPVVAVAILYRAIIALQKCSVTCVVFGTAPRPIYR